MATKKETSTTQSFTSISNTQFVFNITQENYKFLIDIVYKRYIQNPFSNDLQNLLNETIITPKSYAIEGLVNEIKDYIFNEIIGKILVDILISKTLFSSENKYNEEDFESDIIVKYDEYIKIRFTKFKVNKYPSYFKEQKDE